MRASAAAGFSPEMYSASSSRFRSAFASHLTSTDSPLIEDCRDILVTGEFTSVSFHDGLLDFLNLPFVQIYEIANGLCSEKGH